MSFPNPAREQIACRAITDDDRDDVIAVLCRGFASTTPAFWACAFETLRTRAVPAPCPRYGYCLTADDAIVGVLLLIYSRSDGAGDALRCNVSSWYVRPEYRLYAPTLVKVASRKIRCTYTNVSSESHTRQGLLAQGYSCYASGQFIAVPALGGRHAGVTVDRIRGPADVGEGGHGQLLADHAERRCISLTCTMGGRSFPFVFLKRRLPKLGIACAQLVFCENLASFVRLHGDIGRYLLTLRLGVVMFDANGPMQGILGRYLHGRMPKFYMGGTPPRLGDLSYTEDVMFDHGRR